MLGLSTAIGRNKSGQFSEIFVTFHRSSDQVCNMQKSWKTVIVHLQGSTRQQGSNPDTIPQCVAAWLQSSPWLFCKSLKRRWKQLTHVVNLVLPSYGRCTVHLFLSHHQLHVGVKLIRVPHIYKPGRINQLGEHLPVFKRDGLSSRGILRAGS